jgi:hypothetical protein
MQGYVTQSKEAFFGKHNAIDENPIQEFKAESSS